jgi:hypothetical protein
VLIPEGKIALGKLAQALIHGARCCRSAATSTTRSRSCASSPEKAAPCLVNSINPFRIEGQKTAAFEICDVLGDAPDGTASRSATPATSPPTGRATASTSRGGHSTRLPRMLGFQAEGAAPLVLGHPVENPETIATAIRIGNPAERTAGGDGSRRASENRSEELYWHLEVEGDHELERLGRRCVLEQVGAHPVDPDTAILGQVARLLKRDIGEIHTGYLPALLGEPDGVSTLAAGEIERPSRREPLRLRNEKAIRPLSPEEIVSLVTAVPVLFVHVLLDSA